MKKDLKKLALLGLATGLGVATTAVEATGYETMLAAACGSSSSYPAYAPSNSYNSCSSSQARSYSSCSSSATAPSYAYQPRGGYSSCNATANESWNNSSAQSQWQDPNAAQTSQSGNYYYNPNQSQIQSQNQNRMLNNPNQQTQNGFMQSNKQNGTMAPTTPSTPANPTTPGMSR